MSPCVQQSYTQHSWQAPQACTLQRPFTHSLYFRHLPRMQAVSHAGYRIANHQTVQGGTCAMAYPSALLSKHFVGPSRLLSKARDRCTNVDVKHCAMAGTPTAACPYAVPQHEPLRSAPVSERSVSTDTSQPQACFMLDNALQISMLNHWLARAMWPRSNVSSLWHTLSHPLPLASMPCE